MGFDRLAIMGADVDVDADNLGRVVAHAAWCSNEYRSYNPRTDRFLTYEGIYKTCRSPYR